MINLVLAAWTLTALGGLALAGLWYRGLRREGSNFDAGHVERGAITAGFIAPHAAFAVGGLLIWTAAVMVPEGEPKGAGYVLALAMLVVGMVIGTAMFWRWKTARDGSAADAAVPAAAVIAHGLLAVFTLVAAVAAIVSLR
ncbi:hypothetical protein BH10ACT1_BH10ACT1_18090 [soil metagenome]